VKLAPRFRPSATYQWLCAGSTKAIQGLPTGPGSEAADRGTAIHSAVEAALLLAAPTASAFLQQRWATDPEACRIANETHLALLDIAASVDEWRTELPLNIGAVLGQEFEDNVVAGTADFIGYNRATKTLIVADIKTGATFVNPASVQLKLYAIGALALYPEAQVVKTIVVQPLCPDNDGQFVHVKERARAVLDTAMTAFAGQIRAADEPDAVRTPGKHCRYCPAIGMCAVSAEYHLGLPNALLSQDLGPSDLTAAQVAHLVIKGDEIAALLSAVRERATKTLIAGGLINRLKLVRGRGSRSWKDHDAALADLLAAGADPDKIAPRKLASPAQVEAAGFKELVKSHAEKVPGTLRAAWVEAPGVAVNPPAARALDAFMDVETST